VTPDAEARVRGNSVAEGDIVGEIQAKGARVAVLVIDACRDNPFPRSGTRSIGNTRGLADAKPARGVFTIYSAGIGQTALDRLEKNDPNPNSVFTRVFVQQLVRADLHLADLAVDVRERVAELALQAKDDAGRPEPHEQTPAYYDQTIGGRFYLAGRAPPPKAGQDQDGKEQAQRDQAGQQAAVARPVSPSPAPSADAEIVFWQSIPPNAPANEYEEYLRQYPQGRFRVEARNRLAALHPPLLPPAASATAIPPPADPEALFWQGIAGSSRAADFAEYLRDPEGRFAAVARNQLTALQAGQSRAASPPPAVAPQAAVVPAEELLEKGKAALDRKDYAQAMRLFSQAADKGNPRAMRDIAVLYEKGWGVPKNAATAVTWYRRAAEQGDKAAENWLKRYAKR
jgi:hypothetical protein